MKGRIGQERQQEDVELMANIIRIQSYHLKNNNNLFTQSPLVLKLSLGKQTSELSFLNLEKVF